MPRNSILQSVRRREIDGFYPCGGEQRLCSPRAGASECCVKGISSLVLTTSGAVSASGAFFSNPVIGPSPLRLMLNRLETSSQYTVRSRRSDARMRGLGREKVLSIHELNLYAYVFLPCDGRGQHKFWVNGGFAVPPFATSFSTEVLGGRLLAVADEEGNVTLLDSRSPLGNDNLGGNDHSNGLRKSALSSCTFAVHRNAIFDIQWLASDHAFVTGAGDATLRVTSVRDGEALATLTGHSGSVKAVRSMPGQPQILASAGRDGNLMLWDLRCSVARKILPVTRVRNAHVGSLAPPKHLRKTSRGASVQKSVTSLSFLQEYNLLSAGAADGLIKLWDVRGVTGGPVFGVCPRDNSDGRTYGISALDVDASGSRVLASATDSRVYVFDAVDLEAGPVRILAGHISTSFYVKAAFDPTGQMVVSGSEDAKAYIWDLSRRKAPKSGVESHWLSLVGHSAGDVSDVSWCPTDPGVLATACDDTTVKVWKAGHGDRDRSGVDNCAVVNDGEMQQCIEPTQWPVEEPPREVKRRRLQTSITSFFTSAEAIAA